MVAKAIASSSSNPKVTFFMRKGADILSKWVGESERQLHLLFQQAKAAQPSIIFFDEIDGLAPCRSSKQDQIHASIVSTLLALMDGLDSRGQVVVIGATNRIDAVDAALRRPGRFDREFYFGLPSQEARFRIIEIATEKWDPKINDDLIHDLSVSTRGYCGADVKALVTEAALSSVKRVYPEIYDSNDKLLINVNEIKVTRDDFKDAMKRIVPCALRSGESHSYPLPKHVAPLLKASMNDISKFIDSFLPIVKSREGIKSETGDVDYCSFIDVKLLVCGNGNGFGQKYLGAAIIERLEREKLFVQTLDYALLVADSGKVF